eukprot:6177738-Pleurochrysis_carterae.AAC.2
MESWWEPARAKVHSEAVRIQQPAKRPPMSSVRPPISGVRAPSRQFFRAACCTTARSTPLRFSASSADSSAPASSTPPPRSCRRVRDGRLARPGTSPRLSLSPCPAPFLALKDRPSPQTLSSQPLLRARRSPYRS